MPEVNEAWAIGGALSYKSGGSHHLGLGAAFYVSEPLYGPEAVTARSSSSRGKGLCSSGPDLWKSEAD